MGTAGCKAPELLAANTSYMPYNDKVSSIMHKSRDYHVMNFIIVLYIISMIRLISIPLVCYCL
jgi:hypothetical protein